MDQAREWALAVVPAVMAEVYRVLPLRYEGGVLTVAMAADDEGVRADLKTLLGLLRVDGVIWPEDRIRKGIAEHYAGRDEGPTDLLRWLGEGPWAS